jgi:hypothetical protein
MTGGKDIRCKCAPHHASTEDVTWSKNFLGTTLNLPLGFHDNSLCQKKAQLRHCQKSNGAELNVEYELWSSFASAWHPFETKHTHCHDFQPLHRPLNQRDLQSEILSNVSLFRVTKRKQLYHYFSIKCKTSEHNVRGGKALAKVQGVT